MIKVDGVTKSYISKEKQRVDALKGVNFELGNTGMVFVLGKSGSGKSTLLNLLGGLDAPTQGEIVVDGVSMKNFKQADYDSYRNGYVGFIFQEYNLLDSFNVKENVALALQLSKGENIDEKVIASLKQVELSSDYLTRRVGELSGGEKQRVAIARSIVKDSKLILADEPTGNLDSATGESIWNILKTLSKTKLVVVVSHDRESAEKYADRIIEIADGQIVSDNGANIASQQPQSRFVATKKRLPFAVCLRMALNSLFKRKGKSISIVIISILSTFAIAIVQMLLSFSSFDAKIDFIEKYDVPYIKIASNNNQAFDYIAQNSSFISKGVVENKQQVLDFGLTFVGEAQELDENSFYIRLDLLRRMCRIKYDHIYNYALIDGEQVNITEFANSEEQLVGKQIHFNYFEGMFYWEYFELSEELADDELVTLAGIIDTDAVSKLVTTGAYNYLPAFFAKKQFKFWSTSRIPISFGDDDNLALISNGINVFDANDSNFHGAVGILNQEHIGEELVTAQGLVKSPQEEGFTIAEDEIVVSYDLYIKMFDDAKSKNYYVDRDFTELKNLPEHIGETIELKFLDNDGNELLDWGSYKLVGVSFSFMERLELNVNENAIQQFYFGVLYTRGGFLIKTDTVKSIRNFLKTLRDDYGADIANSGTIMWGDAPNTVDRVVWSFDGDVQRMAIINVVFGAVLITVLLLLVVNLISFSITSRKREIGILLALGTTQKDVKNIFVYETLILGVTSLVLMLILLFALITPINMLFLIDVSVYIPFLHIDVLTVAIVFVATLALPLLASWLPISKLSKRKPVDAIRES